MPRTLEIESDLANISSFLVPFIQSGSLNFLFGSGASYPAIKTAGNIKAEIDKLITEGKNEQGDLKAVDFIEAINGAHTVIASSSPPDNVKKVTDGYKDFVGLLDGILFARKNLLLPRQAAIFTTNYDLFFEYSAGQLPSLVLNNGFDRSASLATSFTFSPEQFLTDLTGRVFMTIKVKYQHSI